jgi:hypothetical protein
VPTGDKSIGSERDALFQLLVGMSRLGLKNEVLNNPNQGYAQAFPGQFDKQEHALASQKVAENWGPMVSFLTGLAQETGTGIRQILPSASSALRGADMPSTMGGPKGFDMQDMLANMYGIQSAMGQGAPSFGEALLRRWQQFGQSFGGERGPGARTKAGGIGPPRG